MGGLYASRSNWFDLTLLDSPIPGPGRRRKFRQLPPHGRGLEATRFGPFNMAYSVFLGEVLLERKTFLFPSLFKYNLPMHCGAWPYHILETAAWKVWAVTQKPRRFSTKQGANAGETAHATWKEESGGHPQPPESLYYQGAGMGAGSGLDQTD